MIERDKKVWFSIFLGMIVLSAGVFMVKVRPMQKKAGAKNLQYRMKVDAKKKFIARREGAPTAGLKKAMQEENRLLYTMCTTGTERLGMRKRVLLSEDITRPSIYWLDVLRKTRKELVDKARESEVNIPADLSFGDDIPLACDVPELLSRLRIVEQLVGLVIESGVESVSSLEPASEEIIEGGDEVFLRKLNISFSLEGNLVSLVNFVHSLQEVQSFYAIENISLRSEGGILNTGLTLSTYYYHPGDENITTVENE